MSQQQFIAFLSQEFLSQAFKLVWIFAHVSQRELIDFTADWWGSSLYPPLPPSLPPPTQLFGKAHTKRFMKLPKVWQGVPL